MLLKIIVMILIVIKYSRCNDNVSSVLLRIAIVLIPQYQ